MPSAKKPPPPIAQDIARFAAVADAIQADPPRSLRAVAKELGLTPYLLDVAIERVVAHLGGVPLITTAAKTRATALTEAGLQFAQQLRAAISWKPGRPAGPPDAHLEVRLSISHNLLTSNLITPGLAFFQAEPGRRVDLQVRVRTDLQDAIKNLQLDRLDMALAWGDRKREEADYAGVERHYLGDKFDVVLIGANKAGVVEMANTLGGLASHRVAALRPEYQPGASILPQPDRMQGGDRLTMDTSEAVVACVRGRVAEYGLVVYNQAMLDHYLQDEVLFAEKVKDIDQVSLLAFVRRGARPATAELRRHIETALRDARTRFVPPPTAETALPKNLSFFTSLRFGYYIAEATAEERADGKQGNSWKYQSINLEVDPGRSEPNRPAFRGTIRNSFGITFDCDGRLVGEHFFDLHARVPHGSPVSSEFAASFIGFGRDGGVEFIYGTWNGTQTRTRPPALYGTIWSPQPLSIQRLRRIAHHLRVRPVLDVERGWETEKWPAAEDS